MAARQPNESSPLLPGRSASRTNGAINGPDDSSSLRRLQRARYALIPLLLVAIVGILWVVSGPSSDDATTPWRLRKPLVDSARYSDAELLTLAPPFQVYGHPLPPKMINRSAFATAIPTNAFWSSLLVGDDHGLNVGAGPLTVSPYTLRSLPKRLEASYGDVRRVATKESVTEYFHVDLALTAYAKEAPRNSRLLGDGNSTWRHVVGFDQNSVAVQYRFDNQSTDAELEPTQFMMARLVRGSPYVTVEYQQLKPVLEFNGTVYAINNVPVQELDEPTPGRQQFSGKRFEIDVGVYATNEARLAREKWIVYFANERTLQLQVAEEKDYRVYNLRGELTTPTSIRLVDSDFYTGAVRAAIVPVVDRAGAIAALDKHANVYPVATTVKTQVEGLTALVSLSWTPKTMDGSPVDSLPLLLLAQPHHADSFSKSHQTDSRFKVLSPAFGHRTVKSYMTPVIGNTWVLEEQLPDVGFYGSQIELDQLKQKPDVVEAIATALRNDSNYTPEAQDPYYFGKEIGRQARLALIADTLGGSLNSTRDKILEDLQDWIAPWLVGKNPDMFVYDRDWGGLCSSNGLSGVFWMTDFGNGWYNDHHFHYGYFLYALAVVSKFRPDFAETHKAAMLTIARDIANFNSSDPYFPLTRHFSWYDGHSYASGVYLLDGGKSQESVSEAINAYYGVYLLGKALGVKELEHTGHVLVALESRAARTYWQMPSDSTIYEPVFAQNRMTGQVAATKVSYTTWFGPEIEHMHLINMIPFTPITETFLSPKYVTEEYPVLLKEAFQRPVNPIDDRWRGYAYLDLAIIDPQQAWDQVQKLDFFDDGSSRTNSLFWIATRPKA